MIIHINVCVWIFIFVHLCKFVKTVCPVKFEKFRIIDYRQIIDTGLVWSVDERYLRTTLNNAQVRVTRVYCFEHFYWIRLFISKIVNTSSTPPYKFCQMCTYAYRKDRWYKHIGEVTGVNIFIISCSNQSVDLEMSTTFDGLFRNTHLVYICHIFHF